MNSHPDEYGTNKASTTEPFEPAPSCATSPSLTTVDVAAGTSITVLVTVIGVPISFVPEGEDERAPAFGVALSTAEVVELAKAPKIEEVAICMHPLGEHTSAFGQHPPPASAEHSTRDSKHLGGRDSDAWHWNRDADELQQKMPEGVNDAS
jgi:hypothetical protein